MGQFRVLNFRNYHHINEDDSNPESSGAAKSILDLFFKVYTALYPKATKYSSQEISKDLIEIKNSPPEKKGDVMVSAVSKIAPQLGAAYLDVADKVIDASKEIKKAYDILIKTDAGKKEIESIESAISAKISEFSKSFKAVKESLSYDIFEKKVYPDTRKDIVNNTINPGIISVMSALTGASSEAIKTNVKAALDQLNKLKAELENDGLWEKMSKKERKERIKKIPEEAAEIQKKLSEYQAKAIVAQGFDKEVAEAIKKATELINSALEVLAKESADQVEDQVNKEGGGTSVKDEEEGETDDDIDIDDDVKGADLKSFKSIKSGSEGEEVKDIQAKINAILPKASKIKDVNGKYDAETEKAIKKLVAVFSHTAPNLLSKVDGKTMTPGLQAFLVNRLDNKKDIRTLVRYKA